MKISKHCLPCLLKQIIKTADIAGTENLDDIFHETFEYLSTADFSKSSPDISGDVYRIFSERTGIYDSIRITKKGRKRGRKEAFRLNETRETGQLTADSPPKVDLVLEEKGRY